MEILKGILIMSLGLSFCYQVSNQFIRMHCYSDFYRNSFEAMTQLIHIKANSTRFTSMTRFVCHKYTASIKKSPHFIMESRSKLLPSSKTFTLELKEGIISGRK